MTHEQLERLADYGWRDASSNLDIPDDTEVGRVIAATGTMPLVRAHDREIWCVLTGTVRDELRERETEPCAGDWVLFERHEHGDRASLRGLLPRTTELTRRSAGKTGNLQTIAANIDTVFLVMGLDANFNPQRMERFLTLAWNSGATPVAVLNKADLAESLDEALSEIDAVSPGIDVMAVSAVTGHGIDSLRSRIGAGQTAVLIGSSGVGKSSLLNGLAGTELREVQEIRANDGRGRHTTSLRELFLLPGGGCLIDSPGVREVGLSGDEEGLDLAFADVASLGDACKFRDCTHESEPGCAVLAAIEAGELDAERYESYRKLRREMEYVATRDDARKRQEQTRLYKQRARRIRQFYKVRKK